MTPMFCVFRLRADGGRDLVELYLREGDARRCAETLAADPRCTSGRYAVEACNTGLRSVYLWVFESAWSASPAGAAPTSGAASAATSSGSNHPHDAA